MQEKTLNFTALVHNTKEIPQLEVSQVKNAPYLKYGENNLFPQYLYDLYLHSSQFSSIIQIMKNYVIGNGIVSEFPLKVVNRKYETFDNLIEKLVLDYLIFGGFCLQIIRNAKGDIAELYWVDFRYVRTNFEEDKVYYSDEWSKGRRTPKVYDRFIKDAKQSNSMLYYKGRNTRIQYPTPSYISALTSIEISTQIPEYHLNCLENGFLPGGIINFNNGSNLSEEVMDEIEERIKEKFTGTKNASKILLSFNDNTEHSTTFERLADDGNIDVYQNLSKSVEKDIYTVFRINKLLLGDSSENTGFNKQSYIESFTIYNKTVIQPIQSEIEEVINFALGKGSLHFDEFQVNWNEEGEDNSNIIE